MEKLLFESKGISKRAKMLFTVCSVIMIVFGMFFMFFANAKHKSSGFSISAGGNQIYSGNYGSGYILSDSGRSGMFAIGVIVIMLGIMFFCNMLATGKSYIKIYENHIQGLSCAGMLFFTIKKEYDIEYHQIEDVQVVKNPLFGDSIAVKALGNRYGLLIADNVDQAVALIKQRRG